MEIYRPTWAEINLDHLWHNVLEAKKHTPHKIMIPVIKANAYGHGAIQVMRFLYEKGIRIAAVSLLEEALEIREAFPDIEILMLGPILPNDLIVASKYHIDITIYSQEIYEAVKSLGLWVTCHLKVDSGMSRYGFIKPKEIALMVEELQMMKHVSLKGIYTHFATASEDETFYKKQLTRFKKVLDMIKTLPPMVHISNSSSAFKYEKEYRFTTHYRLGISLYGLSLDNPKPDLKPVMSLKSKIVQIKNLKPLECVGYGATYCAKEDEKIGICPIGYADGWIRKNKTGFVEIKGKKYKIVGIICMDACFIKIDEDVHVGDTATLYGNMISVDDVAKRLHTINYEVCTSLSYRVPRVFIKGEKND
ncbi:MAG: alanine racemase [Acholeplasmataceae bacterium]|nr:alanine racemase [Acholeplasmataceae bacterium]